MLQQDARPGSPAATPRPSRVLTMRAPPPARHPARAPCARAAPLQVNEPDNKLIFWTRQKELAARPRLGDLVSWRRNKGKGEMPDAHVTLPRIRRPSTQLSPHQEAPMSTSRLFA